MGRVKQSMKGYTGKILFVDLTGGTIEEQAVPDTVYENFLSGAGLGAYVLYRHIPRGADPLGPGNVLGFVSGLLTGTGSIVTGRWMALCKSPLTGGWGDANCGGTFSPAIKRCGYDGIFFTGIAEKPVYLLVDDEGARLKDASRLWGVDAVEAEKMLAAEHGRGRKPAVAVIGGAGEKLSLIAGIANDGGRMAARSGCGAVMGSKRLKAVVLAGDKPVRGADPRAIKESAKEYTAKVRRANFPAIIKGGMLPLAGKARGLVPMAMALNGMLTVAPLFKKWGTIMTNAMSVTMGDSPLKNWSGSVRDFNRFCYRRLNPDLIIAREVKKYRCYSCVIGCGGICNLEDIENGVFDATHKPEYETCCAFGALLLNKDLEAIFYINELLNRAGMDSISAGATVAFALECYEKGFLTREDTGGLELTWGNSRAIVRLVEKMIARDGIGDLLADGSRAAAVKIGGEAARYAMQAGGQEAGMHDPRLDPMMGVHFSADPTPGRHTIGSAEYYNLMHLWEKVSWAPRVTRYPKKEEYVPSEREALKAVACACFKQVVDGSGGCLFAALTGVQHWPIFSWLNAAAGWEKTPDEYMEIGRRVQTLRQLFNIREGIEPLSFKIPDRIAGIPPLKEGPLKGKTVAVEAMMKLYWKTIGWDESTGVPLPETVRELGLEESAAGVR